MNGSNIVADTSLLINFFNGSNIARKVMEEQHIWVSCITEIELLSYPTLSARDEKLIRSFLDQCNFVDLLGPVRELTIHLRKDFKLKVPDAIIAATSIYLDFPLVTMDSDFQNVEQLDAVILES